MADLKRISKSEVKYVRSLAQKKFRDNERKFLVEGWKLLNDALESGFRLEFVAVTNDAAGEPGQRSFLENIRALHIDLKVMTEVELKQMSGTVHAQGVIGLAQQMMHSLEDVLAKAARLIVLADRVSDPGNLGTMIRTCDWFRADAMILSEGCADLYNDKVVRSTAGSVFHVPVVEHANIAETVRKVKSKGFRVFATSGTARKSYQDAEYAEKNLLIFGNEATGSAQEVLRMGDDVIAIPKGGRAESLNVAVACGIVLAHVTTSFKQ